MMLIHNQIQKHLKAKQGAKSWRKPLQKNKIIIQILVNFCKKIWKSINLGHSGGFMKVQIKHTKTT
jgi:hypothetical protein